MALLPNIGTTGLFTLAPPFATLLQPNIPYTCVAVRRLTEIVAAGLDPYVEFYLDVGLTQTDLQADMDAGVSIVTLQAKENYYVYVPTSYIVGMPVLGGIPYTTMALVVALGPVPTYLDLAGLKSSLSDTVLDQLGVRSNVTEVVLSPIQAITEVDHASMEAARQAFITDPVTISGKYALLQAQYQAVQTRLQELEAYVAANLPP